MYARGSVEDILNTWTDSDWVGDVNSRNSCRGGCIQGNGGRLTSREAELNAEVKRISECMGVQRCIAPSMLRIEGGPPTDGIPHPGGVSGSPVAP